MELEDSQVESEIEKMFGIETLIQVFYTNQLGAQDLSVLVQTVLSFVKK